MKSYAKFYSPNHPNSCKHPTQTDCTAVKATLRHSGFRAGEVRASSHTKNVNFIVGWGGGGGKDLWKPLKAQPRQLCRQRRQRQQKQKWWWRNPCGKGWDARLVLLPGIRCCMVRFFSCKNQKLTSLRQVFIFQRKEPGEVEIKTLKFFTTVLEQIIR